MFFLFRAAFWLMLVNLFLPADGSTGAEGSRALAAETEASSPAGFCERKPAVCAARDTALAALGDTADMGVRWVTGLVVDHVVGDLAGLRRAGQATSGLDTLTPQDREADWRGPSV